MHSTSVRLVNWLSLPEYADHAKLTMPWSRLLLMEPEKAGKHFQEQHLVEASIHHQYKSNRSFVRVSLSERKLPNASHNWCRLPPYHQANKHDPCHLPSRCRFHGKLAIHHLWDGTSWWR